MGLGINTYLGAYLKYKIKRTETEYSATCCEKCKKSSKGKFCSACGGNVEKILKKKYTLESFYQLLERLAIDEDSLVHTHNSIENDVRYDFVISNYFERYYPDQIFIPDETGLVDCANLDVQKYIENFKTNQCDFISALEKDEMEYSIGFGFISWYS